MGRHPIQAKLCVCLRRAGQVSRSDTKVTVIVRAWGNAREEGRPGSGSRTDSSFSFSNRVLLDNSQVCMGASLLRA